MHQLQKTAGIDEETQQQKKKPHCGRRNQTAEEEIKLRKKKPSCGKGNQTVEEET